MKYLFIVYILIFSCLSLSSKGLSDYYVSAHEKEGEELLQTLHEIINNHTSLTYTALWSAFYDTDAKTNNTVWDIYSDMPGGTSHYEYTPGTNQCGNYSREGDCYNREHTFPTSWFGDRSPMDTDLFQIYPTDGYVNQKRGNYPYGETNSPTWVSTNGSKVGHSSVDGYSATVFEPIDEYKGDLARTYFYMAARYYGQDANWPGSPMVDGAQPKPWAMTMLLKWHVEDPVSPKETARNNAVYLKQGNRNPFIDHPEFAGYIWVGESPVQQEPSNHVASFSNSFITLTWDDAQEGILPIAYLIFISKHGFDNIPVPVNGRSVSHYPTAKYVNYGVGQADFSGLESNTEYYFKIYSFTGSGANTQYKTGATVPRVKLRTN